MNSMSTVATREWSVYTICSQAQLPGCSMVSVFCINFSRLLMGLSDTQFHSFLWALREKLFLKVSCVEFPQKHIIIA